jgi:hypothetical protein
MISPSDPDYIRTKRIKRGSVELSPLYKALAQWIAHNFGVAEPINVEHECVKLSNRPRLQVVFEHEVDRGKFFDGDWNFDAEKQSFVADQFLKLLTDFDDAATDTDNMLVIFTAFEPVARSEANQAVSLRQRKAILEKVNSPMPWALETMFDTVVLFFHTTDQSKTAKGLEIFDKVSELYCATLSQYDEFGYFSRNPIQIRVDSKQNLDLKYDGNLFYYFR